LQSPVALIKSKLFVNKSVVFIVGDLVVFFLGGHW